MMLLQDSREQSPLRFDRFASVTGVRVEALPVGDYHCEYINGTRPPVLFERKSLPDLYGTFTGGYPRFAREIETAARQGWKLVLLIEGTMEEVYHGHPYSALSGSSCVQKAFSLWVRRGLQPVFVSSREEASAFIVETYEAIGRNWDVVTGAKRQEELFGALTPPLFTVGDD